MVPLIILLSLFVAWVIWLTISIVVQLIDAVVGPR